MKTYFNGLDGLEDLQLGGCLAGELDKDQVEIQVLTISILDYLDDFTS